MFYFFLSLPSSLVSSSRRLLCAWRTRRRHVEAPDRKHCLVGPTISVGVAARQIQDCGCSSSSSSSRRRRMTFQLMEISYYFLLVFVAGSRYWPWLEMSTSLIQRAVIVHLSTSVWAHQHETSMFTGHVVIAPTSRVQ